MPSVRRVSDRDRAGMSGVISPDKIVGADNPIEQRGDGSRGFRRTIGAHVPGVEKDDEDAGLGIGGRGPDFTHR